LKQNPSTTLLALLTGQRSLIGVPAALAATMIHMERPGATTLRGNPLTVLGPELQSGQKAPDFSAIDDSLKPVTLASTGSGVRIFSVVPSLDTPVCDAQTKRFNEEAGKVPNLSIYTISMDLPFAQKRWCGAFGVDHVKMVSDHRDGSFGQAYGTLIKELRILSRAIFVLGKDNTIRHVEYVKEVGSHPNYEAALAAAKSAASAAA
jgi:thioredoxin-dependent peroxiredoxin